MSQDIFGYDKGNQSYGGVTGPSFVKVMVGGKQLNFAQSVTLNYGRTVQPVYEIGSGSVWMQPGPAQGTLNINRVVGDGVFNYGQWPDGPCKTVDITISGDGSDCGGGNFGSVKCKQCMPANVGVTIQAGGVTVTDQVTYNVGSVEK